jgi:AcrR family transcriptional regulator
VNYYFGGKDALYRKILHMMFAELGNRMQTLGSEDRSVDPERRLCDLVRSYCAMLFAGGKPGADSLAIFNNEMSQPSALLNELVDAHLVPQNRAILALFRELMGEDAPEWLLRDCAVSVFSQVMYYSTTWVIFSRVNPDHPGMAAYHEHLAEHVCRFSLAGIREMRRAHAAGELAPPDETRRTE